MSSFVFLIVSFVLPRQPLPLAPPEGFLRALAPQSLSSARRLKRGFSRSPREALRQQQRRGALKWSRPHPGRPSGGAPGAGGAAPPRGFVATPRGFDQNEGASQSGPWRPRDPSGEPAARPLLKREVRESPSDPLAAHRCLGGTGERVVLRFSDFFYHPKRGLPFIL